MEIQDIKRWHWAIIGIIAGLALSYSWQGVEPDSKEHMDQAQFERLAASKSAESKKPMLQNVVIRPPVEDFSHSADKQVQLITGTHLVLDDKNQERQIPFAYIAPLPYHPIHRRGTPESPAKSVTDFLTLEQKNNPDLRFRTAWETKSTNSMIIWGGVGLVVIGGIWPTIINLLFSAGLGGERKEKPKKEVSLFSSTSGKRSTPAPKPVHVGMQAAEMQKLDALTAAMEDDLAAAGVSLTPDATSDDSGAGMEVAAPPVIRQLNAEPVAAQTNADEERDSAKTTEELRKQFDAGVFYPVARGHKKDD